MKLIGISGSLRKESFNTRMLHAAAKCLPSKSLWTGLPVWPDAHYPIPHRGVLSSVPL